MSQQRRAMAWMIAVTVLWAMVEQTASFLRGRYTFHEVCSSGIPLNFLNNRAAHDRCIGFAPYGAHLLGC